MTFEQLFAPARLRSTWRSLRKELRSTIARDVIDWTDWALTIDHSLSSISESVIAGEYRPRPATLIEAGKSKGACRVISALNVRDALVFRVVCDRALELALPKQVAGAYFSRRFASNPVGEEMDGADPSDSFFEIWLRYNEYRTRTLLNAPHNVLVLTDISNYFDSIHHSLLLEYLAPLGLPRKAVGLIGRFLDVLRPRSGHSPTPGIGIPVDELDCSRELAHVFLFEHDQRVVDAFGPGRYARWMDDQNVGVANEAEARQVVNMMTKSLAEQRLTLNSGKTRFLSPGEVVQHFWLDANEELGDWDTATRRGPVTQQQAADLEGIWNTHSAEDPVGNWDKILKRFYAMATKADAAFLEARALDDLIRYPHLAARIFGYFARRNLGVELLDLFEAYMSDGENLFEEVESRFFDSLLLLDPNRTVENRAKRLSEDFAARRLGGQTGRPLGRASATIALFWFGAPASRLGSAFTAGGAAELPKEVARAWLATTFAKDTKTYEKVVRALFGHPSDDVLRLVRFLDEIQSGSVPSLGNYKALKPNWPLRGKHYDGQAWLQFAIASQGSGQLLNTVSNDRAHFARYTATGPEQRILDLVDGRLS